MSNNCLLVFNLLLDSLPCLLGVECSCLELLLNMGKLSSLVSIARSLKLHFFSFFCLFLLSYWPDSSIYI